MQGTDLDELRTVSDRLVAYLKDLPAFVGVNSDLDAAMPSVHVAIDRDRAAALGVPPQQIETALGDAFGGQQISQINRPANQYASDPGAAAAIPGESRLRWTGSMSPPIPARWCRCRR